MISISGPPGSQEGSYVKESCGRVEVIDLDSQKAITSITGLNRVHGVAIANDLNRGFISDGGANVVVIFDPKSHAELQRVRAGTNPDGIVYDAPSKRVFAFNGGSQDATVIDAATGNIAGTIPVGGKPEFPVSDGKGNVFVNVEDKNEILKIDPKAMRVVQRWSVAPCDEPSGLAMDAGHNRLFSVKHDARTVFNGTPLIIGRPAVRLTYVGGLASSPIAGMISIVGD